MTLRADRAAVQKKVELHQAPRPIGEATDPRTLGPGERDTWVLCVPAHVSPQGPPWPEHPELESVTFQDPDGTWWIQVMHRGSLRLPTLYEDG